MLALKHNDILTNIMVINRFNVLILQQEDFIDYQQFLNFIGSLGRNFVCYFISTKENMTL